jgi:hypothetical protein
MAWSPPLTAVVNAILNASQWNASVRDNLLETASAKASTPATNQGKFFVSTGTNTLAERLIFGNTIATSQTLGTAGSYLDLGTVGPSVIVTTGIHALVFLSASMANSALNADNFVSFAVSVGTTIAAVDATAIRTEQYAAGAGLLNRGSSTSLIGSLNAAANTFTAKYKVSAITGTFVDRHIVVMGL